MALARLLASILVSFREVMVLPASAVKAQLNLARGIAVLSLVNLISGLHILTVANVIFSIIKDIRTCVGASRAQLTSSRLTM